MYNQIINEIKSNLGYDKAKNKVYLMQQAEKYANHEYGYEIIKEISRLLIMNMTPEEREELTRKTREANPIKPILDEVIPYIQNNDLRNALMIMDSRMNNYVRMLNDDAVSEYHYFSNAIEQALFEEFIGCSKELRVLNPDETDFELYYIYGFLLIEFDRLDEAKNALINSLKLNPVSPRVNFEFGEIYKKENNMDKFYEFTNNALQFTYSSQDLARAYRNLGFYYIEKNNLELATALFKYSLIYDANMTAYSELEYIKSLGYSEELDIDFSIKIIKQHNIQIGPNPLIFTILQELINIYTRTQDFNQLLSMYEVSYDLTKNPNFLDKINKIKIRLK